MPDSKISGLTSATTPLAGTEVLPIVQSSTTKQVSVADLTAGRAISASGLTLSGGTANGVVYLNGSKVVTSGTVLVFDGTNLGVGTSSPGAKLHTQAAIGGTQGIFECTSGSSYLQVKSNNSAVVDAALMFTDGTNTSYFGALRGTSGGVAGALQAYTGGAIRMTLDSAGNLGLGVTPSGWGSSYKAMQIGSLSGMSLMGYGGAAEFGNNFYFDTAYRYAASTFASRYTQSSGTHVWYTAGSGTAGNAISFTQAMTLDASGQLGVGVTSPLNTVQIHSASNTAIRVSTGGGIAQFRGYVIGNNSSDTAEYGSLKMELLGGELRLTAGFATWGGFQTFYTNGTERMRLDASGNLGIGTSSPSERLEVVGVAKIRTSGGSGIQIVSDATPYIQAFGASGNNNLQLNGQSISFWSGASYGAEGEKMRLDSSGNLGLGVTPSASWSGQSAFQVNTRSAFAGSSSFTAVATNAIATGAGWPANYLATGTAALYAQSVSTGAHSWYTAPSGTAGNTISFTQAMTLDASGNLGVGTTSPAYKLDIAGTNPRIRLNETTGYVLTSYVNTGGSFDVGRDNSTGTVSGAAYAGFLNVGGAYPLIFNTNGSERARIPAAGGMVVGTAAVATTATDGFLYVPTCAGTPTGTPTTQTGTAPIVIDTTNNKLYFYSGGAWRDAGP